MFAVPLNCKDETYIRLLFSALSFSPATFCTFTTSAPLEVAAHFIECQTSLNFACESDCTVKSVMETAVADANAHIQSLTGYTFTNNGLLREALDAARFAKKFGNKRLAHLGDSVLNTAIADDWYATPNGGKSTAASLLNVNTS